MADNAIEIKNLVKTYSGKEKPVHALKGIDLNVPKGSFFGLLGANGAGKSTMINILAGLVNKTSGKVSICGNDIDVDLNAAKHKIGVVPQELIIDPFFNVEEALDIYAGYYGIPKAQRRTHEIIEAMGLMDKIKSKPRKLSGGMRRRLLIAKALVHSPEVLILDEPTAGVDVELRTQLWDYVTDLNKKGTTILLTTHYLEEAQELCDQIAVINNGEVIVNDSKRNIMKLLDDKSITLVVNDFDKNKISNMFSSFDYRITDDGNIRLSYKSGEVKFADIIEKINQSGLVVEDLISEENDLEDVFKHLVRNKAV
jgi:ABC-2 type transport system ATP-binding protein